MMAYRSSLRIVSVCSFIIAFWLPITACKCQSDINPCCNSIEYITVVAEKALVCRKILPESLPLPARALKSFSEWRFADSQILTVKFPVEKGENIVREVRHALFSEVFPIPLSTPSKLVAVSPTALSELMDLDPGTASESERFRHFVSGALVLEGSRPLAQRYGGWQFGVWAGQLGDGRAVMLGEYVSRRGERWELQLKGSGLTPYSRRGDGRAVLRSSVREFLVSEAMFFLGIPTSRAAALVVSADPVIRDQFYSGHTKKEPAAVVLRLAQSWFRFGTLELLAVTQELGLLRRVVDFVIETYFPMVDLSNPGRYLAFFQEVVQTTADLVAQWQSVGFAHGVLNTDNFSLLSITIDYGPFGFMEAYDPDLVPNTSDDEGRYSFQNQPDVAVFNLEKLGAALSPLLSSEQTKMLRVILRGYADIYKTKFMSLFCLKLGIKCSDREEDENFIAILLKMMEEQKSDFTMTFRQLGEVSLTALRTGQIPSHLWALQSLSQHKWFDAWTEMYMKHLSVHGASEEVRQRTMLAVNPRYVLRNWMAQAAIDAAERGDFTEVQKLLRVLSHPFSRQQEAEDSGYADAPPVWAQHLRVSCSS